MGLVEDLQRERDALQEKVAALDKAIEALRSVNYDGDAGQEGDLSTPTKSRKKPAPGSRKKPRAARGSLLPESEYEIPILQALDEAGGTLPTQEAIARVGEILKNRMTSVDLEETASGSRRWETRAALARVGLVKRGFVQSDSPRGIWKLSPEGRARLSAAASETGP